MKKIIKKYCYISIPLLTVVVLLLLYISKKINFNELFEDDSSTLIQISGTFICIQKVSGRHNP